MEVMDGMRTEPEATRLDALIEAGREAERAGAWDRALERYEAAFTRLGAEGSPARAAALLRWIGTVRRERRELETATELYEASLAIAEACGLDDAIAAALNCLAIVAHYEGRLDDAETLYGRARGTAVRAGDERLAAMIDQNLGAIANIRGNAATALLCSRSALERYRRLDDRRATIGALNNAGMSHVELGEMDAAEACYREAWRLADGLGDLALMGAVALNRTRLHLARGRYEHARESCETALDIFGRLNAEAGIGEAYKYYGVLCRETEQLNLADLHFGLALGMAEAAQDRLLEAETHAEWAHVHLAERRTREALRSLHRAHHIFGELRARRELAGIAERLERLHETYLPVVRAWGAEAVESKDPFRAGHTERVAHYACALAQAIGLDEATVALLRTGALVHDVGEVVVPATVLVKAGDLTAEERRLMEMHTVVGEQIVGEMDFPWDLRPMVRHHHERWDGSGYPDRLRGEEIPLPARILAVADVYDALTTERSFRPARSPEAALDTLRAEAGGALDPELVAQFVDIVEPESLALAAG